MKTKECKYTIRTNCRLLAEFAQCTPEGMAILLLIVTAPFWGIAYLTGKLIEKYEKVI